jgi:hypothetical protein
MPKTAEFTEKTMEYSRKRLKRQGYMVKSLRNCQQKYTFLNVTDIPEREKNDIPCRQKRYRKEINIPDTISLHRLVQTPDTQGSRRIMQVKH